MHVLVIGRGVPDKQYPMNGVFEFDQARALANNGLQVTFFAIDLRSFRRKRKFGVNSGIQDKVKWYSVDIPIGAVSPIIRRKITTWALEKLYRKVFSESDPDIIHAHFYGPAFSAAKLAEKVHIPLVVTEHCSTMNNSRVSCDILKTASFAYSKASAVIAVGKSLAENIEKNTGFKPIIVPNVMGESDFYQTVINTHHDHYGFVFTGNLRHIKRPLLLIDAFYEVKKSYPNLYLGIIGDGELREKIENKIQTLGLQNNVKLYGKLPREQISDIYADYDCFVLPSASETFGVAYIEALAAGLPIIATACGGPEDFFTPELGIMVPVDDKDALVKAMKTMLESAGHYDSEKLRAYIQERFSEQAVAKQLKDIYTDCIVRREQAIVEQ